MRSCYTPSIIHGPQGTFHGTQLRGYTFHIHRPCGDRLPTPLASDSKTRSVSIHPRLEHHAFDALRKQAKTYEGPLVLLRRYLIPFTSREEFEAAWPHIQKVKSKGAPIILVRGPKTDFFKVEPAGVMIQTPPVGSQEPEEPVPGDRSVRSKWQKATFIELVVDGQIVDLNRIELPANTPIVDERFRKK